MVNNPDKTNSYRTAAYKPRRMTSLTANNLDMDELDLAKLDPAKISKEYDYWNKPDILAYIDWITNPKLFPRFKDPRGVAGKSKNEIFHEIATYINTVTNPLKPMNYMTAKSRFQVIKGKYDKAVEVLKITGSKDTVLTLCPHFDRLHSVLESGLTVEAPEAGPSSAKRTITPSVEPDELDEIDEIDEIEEGSASSDGKALIGRGKRLRTETPAVVISDVSTLQIQTEAPQENVIMETPVAEETYYVPEREQQQQWEWSQEQAQAQEQVQEQAQEWEQGREQEHGYKFLRAEAESDALLQQRRMDLETYYQHRAKEMELSLKARGERLEDEYKERCKRLDDEHRRRLEDFRVERQLFLEQQRRFDEFRTNLECRLASQYGFAPTAQPSRTYSAYSRPHQTREQRFE